MTSPDELLKQLHEAARRAREPDPALRQDMLRALSARIHARPSHEPRGEAEVAAPAATGVGVGKVVLLVVPAVLFAVLHDRSGDTAAFTRDPAPTHVQLEVAPVEAAVPDPQPEPIPVVVSVDEASLPTEPPRPRRRSRTRARVAESAGVSSTSMAEEVALIKRISAAMAGGQPSAVLEFVAEHEARFPTGTLIEEREAARARATCRLGQREAGEALTVRFERRWPNSMQLVAVLHDCREKAQP